MAECVGPSGWGEQVMSQEETLRADRHLLNMCGKAAVTSAGWVVLSPPFTVGALDRKRETAFPGLIPL